MPVFTEENFTDLHGLAAPASPASENEAGQSPAPEFVLSNPLPPDAARIRQEVFVQEQGFAEEFDSIDRTAWHLVLYRGGQPAAVCRFFPGEEPGSYTVGRLAVRRPFRKMSLGAQVLAEAERRIAALGGKKVVLAAQVRAGGFYLRQGYVPPRRGVFGGILPAYPDGENAGRITVRPPGSRHTRITQNRPRSGCHVAAGPGTALFFNHQWFL